jgi:hypothetical protein
MLPLVYPEVATREMGSPPRIHASQPAQPIVTLDMARTTTVGPALWTFHTQGKFDDVDTLLVMLGVWVGVVDAGVCWEGEVPRETVIRGASGAGIAGMG